MGYSVTMASKAMPCPHLRENTGIVTVNHSFVSTDPVYAGAQGAALDVRVFDNDSARVLVTESEGSTRVVQGGTGDDYTLRLVSNPGATVYVNLYGDGQTVFTGANTAVSTDNRLVVRSLGDSQVVNVNLATNGAAADTITRSGALGAMLDPFAMGRDASRGNALAQ